MPRFSFLSVGLPQLSRLVAMSQKKGIQKAGVNGVGMPKCQHCPDPEYSQEARKNKYQGVVVLVVVVTVEGKVRNIQIMNSLGMGLDEMANRSVRKWRFKAAMKDGKPVDAQLPSEITFRL
jgi:TonB family protein